ncbi:hypothetical protein LguiA_034633 [Lonicera macranthoides]
MALETWLIKVKKTISHSFNSVHTANLPTVKSPSIKKSTVGVLAFEIAGLISKLLHLWQSITEQNMTRLRNESLCLEGVRKIVSNDEAFLLTLACAEIAENLRLLANSVSNLSKRCQDLNLKSFDRFFDEFVNTGLDSNNWVLSWNQMESKIKKMDRYVNLTAGLRREMDELSMLESGLKKLLNEKPESSLKSQKIIDLQQKILWQRQEVKYMKEKSLWSKNFDVVTSLLVRPIFTVFQRIKLVFGIGILDGHPISLPRSLSASSLATVYPSDQNLNLCNFVSGPLKKTPNLEEKKDFSSGFFESNSKKLKPPTSTLGAAALALHYANLIIVMEKMIRSPQLVGVDVRDDLYSMLPSSVRFSLRDRLKGVGFSASDPVLAAEWRDALGKILGWLSPLAHNMIKWQNERSFEQQTVQPKTNVLLFQTLHFANQEKTEAAITELLVGLNYIWRFDREMNAKALFECNFNGS